MENAVIERINMVISSKSNSPRAFANAIGFNYSTLNGYLSGRRSTVDIDLINKIISTYDNISGDWIISGKGEMEKTAEIKNENEQPESATYWKAKYDAVNALYQNTQEQLMQAKIQIGKYEAMLSYSDTQKGRNAG